MSEQKDCTHCDHLSHVLTVYPAINVYRCCHCGRERKEQQATHGSAIYAQGQHGPFAPDFRTYFGAPQ